MPSFFCLIISIGQKKSYYTGTRSNLTLRKGDCIFVLFLIELKEELFMKAEINPISHEQAWSNQIVLSHT